MSSSQSILLFVCQSELAEFCSEPTEFAADLSQFSRPKQCSRKSIPPVHQTHGGWADRVIEFGKKGVFWRRGLFRKVHFLEILENLEILEILENPQTVENKGESDHFLEILENLEIQRF